jgi:phosphatidylglycerol lysyltransferase
VSAQRQPGRERFGPLLAVALFAGAVAILHRELAAYTYRDIAAAVARIPGVRLAQAAGLTALAYSVLPGYDAVALSYVRHRLPFRRIAFGSIIAYSLSQTLGFALVTGGSVRYRLWSSWGLSSAEVAGAVTFIAFSFGLGMLLASGVVFLLVPADTAALLHLPFRSLAPLGALNLALVATYVAWTLVRRRPIRLFGRILPVPAPRLVAAQLTVAALDWTLAGATLFALLPAGRPPFATFLGLYLIAQFAGILSHVPGGLGVLETLLVLLLKPYLPASDILGALVAYRGVFYLLPFAVGVFLLGVHESRPYRTRAAVMARTVGGWVPRLLPQALSAAVFLTGAILLFSGATPAIAGRLEFINALLPLGIIEVSHFAGSLVGAALLVLAWGLWHRLDAAFGLTVVLLGLGIGVSLLKGGDWEEALLLTGVLAALVPAHRHFYRRAALGAQPLEAGWVAAIVAVLGASVWLGLFAHRHVEYASELWWRFELDGDAPRFLRATVGAVAVVLLGGLRRLLRHAPGRTEAPTTSDLDRAAAVVAASDDVSANLALLGDKALLFSETGRSFLAYGVSGRSWVALGDPVGDPAERQELAWRFRELADRHGGATVFYEVGVAQLPLYIDLGLTLLKLGEEARVPLADFSLDGGNRKGLRRNQRTMEREGTSFEIVNQPAVAALLPTLRGISDAWLREKRTREKGFSLGRFDERYITRFPVALVRHQGEVVAFANLWTTDSRRELSVDLMRYLPAAPAGVMQFLFTSLMLWGRAEGYGSFTLGMAPLAGLENRALAPLWSRLGALMYRHGEHFYHFKGLREYKNKYDPVWEPKYLASPGGLALARVLANVAALIGGGIAGVIAK